jgi:hypothetical protein
VIGRTFRTGETTLVEEVAGSRDYLLAVASVVAEVCVPLRVDGRVRGVLNAESPTAPGESGVGEVERCARMLSGAAERPRRAERRLARTAARAHRGAARRAGRRRGHRA